MNVWARLDDRDPARIISGYVVEIRYRYDDGRAVPFHPEDDEFDLRFRTWFPNGFSSRIDGAQELDAKHRLVGWESQIRRGVAELGPAGTYDFHILQ